MEALSSFWEAVVKGCRCRRPISSFSDFPPGIHYGTVAESRQFLVLEFKGDVRIRVYQGSVSVPVGCRVSYYRHPQYSSLTYLDCLPTPVAIRILAATEECLIATLFDHLDYINLPLDLISRIEGQLEPGGTGVLMELGEMFEIRSMGKSRRRTESVPMTSFGTMKYTAGFHWEPMIPEVRKYALAVHRSPISELQADRPFNLKFQAQVRSISTSISGWRWIRGDGNCYYRAVGVAYLEHLARKSTPENELFSLKLKVANASGLYHLNPGFETGRLHFAHLLDLLIEHKTRHPGSALFQLQPLLQNPDFDEGLFLMMRNLCFNHVILHAETLADFQGDRGCSPEDVLRPGVEAEGVALASLASVLGVSIWHYVLDGKTEETYIEKYDPERGFSPIPILHLAYFPGHYDLLYSRSQDIVDGYSYFLHDYDVSETYDSSAAERLYTS